MISLSSSTDLICHTADLSMPLPIFIFLLPQSQTFRISSFHIFLNLHGGMSLFLVWNFTVFTEFHGPLFMLNVYFLTILFIHSSVHWCLLCTKHVVRFSSVQSSHSVVSDSLQPHGLQHTKLPCLSAFPRACSISCPLSWRCYPTILSSVVPFSSCLQSVPA